jgi:hypothetical protein
MFFQQHLLNSTYIPPFVRERLESTVVVRPNGPQRLSVLLQCFKTTASSTSAAPSAKSVPQ